MFDELPVTRDVNAWPGFADQRNRLNVFWVDSSRRGWPSSTTSMVFLGDAVLQIGAALFPNDWTDDDPSLPLPSGKSIAVSKTRNGVADFTANRATAEEARRRWAWYRFATVIDVIADAARAGAVELLHVSPTLADEPEPFRPIWLQAAGLDHIFHVCRINFHDPHRAHQSGSHL